ncbi:hypothetical protein GCM10022284_43430 [Streptomyces hundungensis]
MRGAAVDGLPYGWGVELIAMRHPLRKREDGAAFAHVAERARLASPRRGRLKSTVRLLGSGRPHQL